MPLFIRRTAPTTPMRKEIPKSIKCADARISEPYNLHDRKHRVSNFATSAADGPFRSLRLSGHLIVSLATHLISPNATLNLEGFQYMLPLTINLWRHPGRSEVRSSAAISQRQRADSRMDGPYRISIVKLLLVPVLLLVPQSPDGNCRVPRRCVRGTLCC